MENNDKLIEIFTEIFSVEKDDVMKLRYRESDQWDSIGHMSLISALEDEFGIEFEPDEIRSFHSYEDGIRILAAKGIEF